jgi:hypothetical protein
MKHEAVTSSTELTLPSAVAAAWDGAHDLDAATSNLVRMLDADLMAQLVQPHVESIARELMRANMRETRRVAWERPAGPDARARRVGAVVVSSLLDFRLPSGVLIANATKADLTAAAVFYRKQAEDMAWKARWVDLVATKVGRKTVADVLDAAKLSVLQEQAK